MKSSGFLPEVAPVGAWIEILRMCYKNVTKVEVAPVGAWIEIIFLYKLMYSSKKSPLLGRGLKYLPPINLCRPFAEVAPVGAWIEILHLWHIRTCQNEVAPVGAWIEIRKY